MSGDKQSGRYNYKDIEPRWQKFWEENNCFQATDYDKRPKYYVLDMFPYPSGSGLHVGHVEGYTASDIVSRYKRMQGFNVLHPMGWDAFGLPAEQFAIKTNTHPKHTTEKNIKTYMKQLKRIGLSYDWQREINTTDPSYYRWTQWIFTKLHKKGLAYQAKLSVNWCPELGTVLADEEIVDGKSEVGGFAVERKEIKQWVLKITEYAEQLLNDLDGLEWPNSTKEMQKNWIGKSEGCYLDFNIEDQNEKFSVFTTRQDTLWGVSFCVLAPEHPLISKIVSKEQRGEVEKYIELSKNKSNLERTSQVKNKTGVYLGAYAINPANEKKVPIYTADYVLMNYGTGAVMGVPAHDARDHEFALKYNLEITPVLKEENINIDVKKEVHTVAIGQGTIINSDFINGMSTDMALKKVSKWAEEKGIGKHGITYRLRDWIFSRQRYWGEPFPIIHDSEGNSICIDDADLPVLLPDVKDFKPNGSFEPPLASQGDWVNHKAEGKNYKRETNIMPQWAGSCWYYLRFLDPKNDHKAWDENKEKYWMPVDLYIGGAEHANLHLLYARFWHKVLYDIGLVSEKEPFKKLVHPGVILGENSEKMSKSKGNVVNPDDVIEKYGADTLRLFEMFLGPIEQSKPWQTRGIVGIHRFLNRVWRLIVNEDGSLACKDISANQLEKALARTVKKVTEDTESLQFNTAIAAMMEFVNLAYKLNGINKNQAEIFTKLLSPYAPHLAEEIWLHLGNKDLLMKSIWPSFNKDLITEDTIKLAVMINGKTRGTITIEKNADKESIINLAKEQEFTKRNIKDKEVVKVIVVPSKIVNFVLGK